MITCFVMSLCKWCIYVLILLNINLGFSFSIFHTLIEIVYMGTMRTEKKKHMTCAWFKKILKCVFNYSKIIYKKNAKCNHIIQIRFRHLVRRKRLIFFGREKCAQLNCCSNNFILSVLLLVCSLLLVWITRTYFICLNRTIECQTWVAFDASVVVVASAAITVAAFYVFFWTNIIGNSWWLPI